MQISPADSACCLTVENNAVVPGANLLCNPVIHPLRNGAYKDKPVVDSGLLTATHQTSYESGKLRLG